MGVKAVTVQTMAMASIEIDLPPASPTIAADLAGGWPGPFVVEEDRLPGSRRYMAPEEFVHGAVIDERSTVFTLGRTIWNLLDAPAGWRGTPRQASVVAAATDPDRTLRFPSVAELAHAWRDANVPVRPG